MLDTMSMVMLRLDLCAHCFLPCFVLRFASVHAYCLDSRSSMFMCLDLCFHMFACLNLGFHMLVCLGLFSLLALCVCALHAMIVCLDIGYVCHAMCYCSPFVALSFFLVFLLNG